jgi:hypothetical protein
MTRRGSICLVLFTMFGLGSCGSSGSGSSPAAAAASSSPTTPVATVASSSATTAAATVESGTPTTPVDPAALVDLLMKTFKVTNRPCVEKAVSEFPEDVLKIVESIAKNGNPTDNWPDNRALALVHIVQACPNGP